MDLLLSAIPGLAIVAGCYVLFRVGKAAWPKLVAAGSWLKSKFAGAGAEIERLDDDIDHAFSRIATLEAQMKALGSAAVTAVGGQAVADAIKTAAADVAPAFLQPKDPAPAAIAAAAPAAQA